MRTAGEKHSAISKMAKAILDSSAVLAFVNREAGWEKAEISIPDCAVSSVNLAEIVAKLLLAGGQMVQIAETVDNLALTVEPFDERRAVAAASWISRTRSAGLSLADCACLSLAEELSLPVVTADRAWSRVDCDLEIQMIR